MRGLVQFSMLANFTLLILLIISLSISYPLHAAVKTATVSIATTPDYTHLEQITVFINGKKVSSLTNSYDDPGSWFKVKLKKGSHKLSVLKRLDAEQEYYGEKTIEINPDLEKDPHVIVELKKRPKGQTIKDLDKAKEESQKETVEEKSIKSELEIKNPPKEEAEETNSTPDKEKIKAVKILKLEDTEDAVIDKEPKAHIKDEIQVPHTPKIEKKKLLLADIPIPDMIKIPAGSFTMGCDAKPCAKDEKPAHKVNLKAFSLAKYEVTVAAWKACYQDGGCTHSAITKEKNADDEPITNVSWKDAQEYIRWLNKRTGKKYRLPTEAEWEYAARAGTTSHFAYGDCIDSTQANFNGKYKVANKGLCKASKGHFKGGVVNVGQYPANKFGLHDMHGNVWEWVEDCWHDSYDKAKNTGAAHTKGNCSLRVLRGGSWVSPADNLRSSYRFSYMKSARDPANGFRLAR